MREGARKGLWPQTFADTHTFKSDPVIVEPDVTQLQFTDDDEFLIMATDGLWDAIPVPEVVAAARKWFVAGRGAQEVADKMADLALKRYTSDNVSVVVVDLRRGRELKPLEGKGGWLGGLFGGR